MVKFRREFELLVAPLDHSLLLEVMESTFLNGLKEEIRAELGVWEVSGLDKIMGLAQKIEEKNGLLKKQLIGPSSTKIHYTVGSPTSSSHFRSLTKHQVALDKGTSRFQPPFKKLYDVDLQRRHERGLCYKRDEKFHPGHRCKNKELQVLVV